MNDSTINVEAIWERTLQILRRDETVSPRVMALLTLSRLMAVVADTALLAAPSTSAKELFEHRIVDSLKQALSEASGREMRFAVTVDESLLLEGDDDEMPSSAMTSRSSAPGAQSVDNSVDSSTGSVHNSGSDGGFTRADGTSSTTDAEQDRSGIGPSAGSSFGAGTPGPCRTGRTARS